MRRELRIIWRTIPPSTLCLFVMFKCIITLARLIWFISTKIIITSCWCCFFVCVNFNKLNFFKQVHINLTVHAVLLININFCQHLHDPVNGMCQTHITVNCALDCFDNKSDISNEFLTANVNTILSHSMYHLHQTRFCQIISKHNIFLQSNNIKVRNYDFLFSF